MFYAIGKYDERENAEINKFNLLDEIGKINKRHI